MKTCFVFVCLLLFPLLSEYWAAQENTSVLVTGVQTTYTRMYTLTIYKVYRWHQSDRRSFLSWYARTCSVSKRSAPTAAAAQAVFLLLFTCIIRVRYICVYHTRVRTAVYDLSLASDCEKRLFFFFHGLTAAALFVHRRGLDIHFYALQPGNT